MIEQKTYNTFQEAKIDNPTYEVCVRNDHKGGAFQANPKGVVINEYWKICNPADYCMTVEEFLKAGHKFEVGDVVIDVGMVSVIYDSFGVGAYNEPDSGDCNIYILRAAALEKPKRTKVEYVKVTDSIFDLKDEFERGDLYFDRDACTGGIYASSEKYQKIIDMTDFNQAALNNNIYRKVETEIDERQEFIDAACNEVNATLNSCAAEGFARLYDSGKFKLIED